MDGANAGARQLHGRTLGWRKARIGRLTELSGNEIERGQRATTKGGSRNAAHLREAAKVRGRTLQFN
jgi:hypothetical protein